VLYFKVSFLFSLRDFCELEWLSHLLLITLQYEEDDELRDLLWKFSCWKSPAEAAVLGAYEQDETAVLPFLFDIFSVQFR